MKITRIASRLLCFIIVLIMLCGTVAAGAEQSTDNSILNGCHTLDGTSPLLGSYPIDNVQSAILYDTNSDTLLYSWNPDMQMSPSSLAKLVTAMVAIEQGDLSEIVVADGNILETIPWDAVSVGLQPNEEMTLLDLLYCMLVGSGNDAAAVIAVHMDGSLEKFAERMNAFSASIGCTSSNYTNPHGLHDDDQYTTARDAAKLMAYASKNEIFADLIGAKDYTVPQTNLKGERILTTQNHLISRAIMSVYYDSRVTGGRTGVADDGSRCVASTAKKGSLNLISVVMGCRNSYAGGTISTFGGFPETTALLDMGFQGLRAVQIFNPGQVLKQYPIANADGNLYIGVHDSCKTVLPSGVSTDDLRFVYQETGILAAPVEKDAPFGVVDVYWGSNCIASASLYALNKVPLQQVELITDRVKAASQGIPPWVILVLLAVLFIAALILLRYSKRIRKIVKKKYRRKRRM